MWCMSKGLILSNITKSYGSQKILKDFNLEISDGEFIVLVGPSGSGKSTVIRTIAGLEEQDSGEIIFNGENIEHRDPKDRNLSMVFQNYALYPHKSVYDNIAFPLTMEKDLEAKFGQHKDRKEIINKEVSKIAQKLGIEQYLERKPRELSGGQRQRVALARAMIKKPKIFLMDEPLSNLDAQLRGQLRSEIKRLHRESGSIFIYVTHDQTEALSLGDRIVVLKEGQIQQIDNSKAIYNQPQNTFVASFIGNPPVNLLRLDNENFKDKIVGIRAEDLKLSKQNGQDQCVNMQIRNVEMHGNEHVIYGLHENYFGVQKILARISLSDVNDSSTDLYREDENLKLYFHLKKVYYFDVKTGKRL